MLPSDPVDLPRLRAGDPLAFEALFRAYHARLCRLAYGYLRNAAEAEELVQDVFLSLWRVRAKLEVTTSIRAYLFRAVRNRVLNRSGRAKLEQRWLQSMDSEHGEVTDDTPTADALTEESQLAERVRAAIHVLPPG